MYKMQVPVDPKTGQITDPNFKGEKLRELHQEDKGGKVVPFDKDKPLPGPTFGLIDSDKD